LLKNHTKIILKTILILFTQNVEHRSESNLCKRFERFETMVAIYIYESFARVWISSKTPTFNFTHVRYNDGINPMWDSEVLRFTCNDTCIFDQLTNLTIAIYHRGSQFDTPLGQVKIPLTIEYLQERKVLVEERVILSNGKKQGTVKFLVRII